jgi:hypothetical protein
MSTAEPPISRAIAARSGVVATTLMVFAGGATIDSAATAAIR